MSDTTDIDRYPQLSGPLYRAVQREGVFEDSKTFVDCVPQVEPAVIRERFRARRDDPDFDLAAFVHEHFDVPSDETETPDLPADRTMHEHVDLLWDHLTRPADADVDEWDTRIPLPRRYVVPGGRFREMYYWDTYFAAEGLAADGRVDLVADLAEDYASLVERVGHVPNGARLYFRSRSQPPLFYRLVAVLERERGFEAVEPYLDRLDAEHGYWLDGAAALDPGEAHRHAVNLDGTVLNRYWDDRPEPRPESYREDRELAADLAPDERPRFFRDVRAACESGWDFSSRWLADPDDLRTIRTTDLLPVDLNAYLFGMETHLAEWFRETGADDRARDYERRAAERREAVEAHCWDPERGTYVDYDWRHHERAEQETLACAVPLFTGLASDERAAAVAERLEAEFLQAGGLPTTLVDSPEQWDWPNGWAPLQYVAVRGLQRYGHDDLARDVAERWLSTNRVQFERTGTMHEKYDVVDPESEAGGGEYELQEGFGWTNGVVSALRRDVDLAE